jgi:hypothetical protein
MSSPPVAIKLLLFQSVARYRGPLLLSQQKSSHALKIPATSGQDFEFVANGSPYYSQRCKYHNSP